MKGVFMLYRGFFLVAGFFVTAATGVATGEARPQRLASASDGLTIAVAPQVLGPSDKATVFGAVADGRAGQLVTVQFKQCGLYPVRFRDVHEAPTAANGSYSVDTWRVPSVNGVYRAVAGDRVSAEVSVRGRPLVHLQRASGGAWSVRVTAVHQFYRKRVLIQRFGRRLGIWTTVKTVVLTKQVGGGPFVHSSAEFRAALPKGTTLRAVFPASQAKPCYLAGYSKLVRT
jgi:hypothetical protein